MKTKIKRTVYNGGTASIVTTDDGEIHEANENSRIILEEKVEYDNENNIIEDFNKGEKFVKLFDCVIPELRKRLTPSEFVFAISLSNFVSYNDCVLRKSCHGNSVIIDAKDIADLLEMDYSVVRRLILSLKKKGVIGQHETGSINKELDTKMKKVYTVNPYIYFRGINVNETVKEFYVNSGWNELYQQFDE